MARAKFIMLPEYVNGQLGGHFRLRRTAGFALLKRPPRSHQLERTPARGYYVFRTLISCIVFPMISGLFSLLIHSSHNPDTLSTRLLYPSGNRPARQHVSLDFTSSDHLFFFLGFFFLIALLLCCVSIFYALQNESFRLRKSSVHEKMCLQKIYVFRHTFLALGRKKCHIRGFDICARRWVYLALVEIHIFIPDSHRKMLFKKYSPMGRYR